MFSLTTPQLDIEIAFSDESNRKTYFSKESNQTLPIYFDGETVSGRVQLRTRQKVDHQGVKIDFIGLIQQQNDKTQFTLLSQPVLGPGVLVASTAVDFEFKNVEKQFESYVGINVVLKYFVRVVVSRRLTDLVKERLIWVYGYKLPVEINSNIKMEVGIEDCLHIEFEYNKNKFFCLI